MSRIQITNKRTTKRLPQRGGCTAQSVLLPGNNYPPPPFRHGAYAQSVVRRQNRRKKFATSQCSHCQTVCTLFSCVPDNTTRTATQTQLDYSTAHPCCSQPCLTLTDAFQMAQLWTATLWHRWHRHVSTTAPTHTGCPQSYVTQVTQPGLQHRDCANPLIAVPGLHYRSAYTTDRRINPSLRTTSTSTDP